MLESEIKIGIYLAKVSGHVTRVKITDRIEATRAGRRESYVAVNQSTGREVTIKSAASLRGEVTPARCLKCDNCLHLIKERAKFNEAYAACFSETDVLFHSDRQAEAQRLRQEYRVIAGSLPCSSPKGTEVK